MLIKCDDGMDISAMIASILVLVIIGVIWALVTQQLLTGLNEEAKEMKSDVAVEIIESCNQSIQIADTADNLKSSHDIIKEIG